MPVLLLAACAGTGPDLPPQDNDLRLLFIGNSLTYTNDLPAMVRQLGLTVGGKAPVVESVTIPDFSLEDHWNRGDAQQAIRRDKWDFVVLQQGPSALPESRVLLVEYTRKFAEEIRTVGGRPALYMVWPPASRAPEWDQVTAVLCRRGARSERRRFSGRRGLSGGASARSRPRAARGRWVPSQCYGHLPRGLGDLRAGVAAIAHGNVQRCQDRESSDRAD